MAVRGRDIGIGEGPGPGGPDGTSGRLADAIEPAPPLVDAAWCLAHLDHPGVRFVEVDDRPGRSRPRIPGSIAWAWDTDLCDPIRRDVAGPAQLSALLARSGIGPRIHVVLYGDPGNWFAAWAFWLLRLHGVQRLSLVDGGRAYWAGNGYPVATQPGTTPASQLTSYPLAPPSRAHRAFRDDVVAAIGDPDVVLVDARSPREYSGELIAPPGSLEGAQRGGHIPGAISVPWDLAVTEAGTFKPRDQLIELYRRAGVGPEHRVITYCRIGERSSHSWFVLHELLGYPRVQNYDGSWSEWGSSIGFPIEH